MKTNPRAYNLSNIILGIFQERLPQKLLLRDIILQ